MNEEINPNHTLLQRGDAVIRGNNFTRMPCYPDTCVLVNAFLEDTSQPKYTSQQECQDAVDFFEKYDGPGLMTSPMVLAEFIFTATRPDKYNILYNDAVKIVEDIFEVEKFSLSVPTLKIHEQPTLNLAPIFSYSLKLEGTAAIDGSVVPASLTMGRGYELRSGYFDGIKFIDPTEITKAAHWEQVTLAGSLYDLLISAIQESSSSPRTPLQFQDAMVLSFARGLPFVDFVTSDKGFYERLGWTTGDSFVRPYSNMRVWPLEKYVTQL